MSEPIVSVIMANFNGAAHIAAALKSVLAQSLTDIEVIVTDDASTDASVSIATSFAERDARVVVLQAPQNAGPAFARNRALDVARGEWVAIVDSDDIIHPERFERLIGFTEKTKTDGVADDLICFYDDAPDEPANTLLGENGPSKPALLTPDEFVDSTALAPQLGYLKPMLRRDVIGKLRYREDIRIGEDHDFYMKFMLEGGRFHILPQAYYLYRKHSRSLSHRLHPNDVRDMITAQDELLMDYTDVSTDFKAKCANRRDALVKTMAFESVVQDIKGRSVGSALRTLAERPALLGELASVARSKLARGNTRPESRGTAAARIALGAVAGDATEHGGAYYMKVPQVSAQWTAQDWAAFTSSVNGSVSTVTVRDAPGLFALGYLPNWGSAVISCASDVPVDHIARLQNAGYEVAIDNVTDKAEVVAPLVHIRTPTYKRPEALRRCLNSLVDQTHENWICDVYDDDPDGSAKEVVNALNDPRMRFNQNDPQRFASKNIDKCFSSKNPHNADYFFVLEDDNYVLDRFIADNISICNEENVQVVFRNQLVEFQSGTDAAHLSKDGILDDKFNGGLYAPDVFRLCLMADIGVSNGGLFWSRQAVSDLEIHFEISATLQEYMRTFAICEPIYVAMEPLAVWAENGEATTRDLGNGASYLRRELSLKRSVGILQRKAWSLAPSKDRLEFLTHPAFRYPASIRAAGLIKSHAQMRVGGALGTYEKLRLALRGAFIRILGRPEPQLSAFVAARKT